MPQRNHLAHQDGGLTPALLWARCAEFRLCEWDYQLLRLSADVPPSQFSARCQPKSPNPITRGSRSKEQEPDPGAQEGGYSRFWQHPCESDKSKNNL